MHTTDQSKGVERMRYKAVVIRTITQSFQIEFDSNDLPDDYDAECAADDHAFNWEEVIGMVDKVYDIERISVQGEG